MQNLKKSTSVSFLPAQLSKGKEWFIYYYVINPNTGTRQRVREKCNRVKNKREKEKFAKYRINEINEKLYAGWNPFLDKEAPKANTKLKDAIERFFKIRQREQREDGLRTYKSSCNVFLFYLHMQQLSDIYMYSFTEHHARKFMNYVFEVREVSPRTYNNYHIFLHTLWNWFVEEEYCLMNVFSNIKRKKEQHKKRVQLISPMDRDRIKQYYLGNNPYYYALCMLAFHCLFRRKEITTLKVKNIDFRFHTISIDGKYAKNGKNRNPTIPDSFYHSLKQLYFTLPKDMYLFSNDNFIPGYEQMNPKKISDEWSRMRKITGINTNTTFYSLRDCGIIQKIRDGIPADVVMYQADHSSMEVTNKYIKMANVQVLPDIKNMASEF